MKKRPKRHWKDTLLKSNQIRWRRPLIKNIDDGKLDILITVPLTALFEVQAKQAYAKGAFAAFEFIVDELKESKPIEIADIDQFFTDCGLGEVAKLRQAEQSG